ncbi:MAG: T9SS type A sorting domain-containing protein, partial [Ignavibacteria bacterium]|nr:T9SS type A sorting domain-containing protein [Ignavibacteria bacterium]
NTYNFVRYIAPEISAAGKIAASCTNEAITDNLISLNSYELAAYILEDESTANETLSSAEQEKIKYYLQSGGKLFISGSEITWDLDYKGSATDKDFCWNYLKAKYIADAPNSAAGTVYQAASYTAPGGVLPAILFDNGTHGTWNVQYPDVIKNCNGSTQFMSYNTVDTVTGGAAIAYSGIFPAGSTAGKLIVMGFPFETIYTASQRTQLMNSFLQWFDTPVSVLPIENIKKNYNFTLEGNYPNPFNPATKICYTLPESGTVKICIYDSIGRLLQSNNVIGSSAGKYEYLFNASAYSSGIYIYTVRFNKVTLTGKMICIK